MIVCACCDKETTNPMFCSRSCSARINNKYRKRFIKNIDAKKCNRCGLLAVNYEVRQHCQSCKNLVELERVQTTPICKYIHTGNARIKYSSIRKWALRTMFRMNIPKLCSVCGFDIVVECCHIKPIGFFSENQLMGEVNSLSNLIWLCPNHHAMLDRGLLHLPPMS